MGKTKKLLEQEWSNIKGHIADAEYMEWVQYSQQIYLNAIQQKQEQPAEQIDISEIANTMGLTQDEFGIYSCGEEDN